VREGCSRRHKGRGGMRLDKPVAGGPCWAAVGTPDLEAGGRFYGELFGWRTETAISRLRGWCRSARRGGRARGS